MRISSSGGLTLWVGVLFAGALGACAKPDLLPPYLGPDQDLEGGWFLATGFDGPVTARFSIDDDRLILQPFPEDEGQLPMNYSVDQGEWEARAVTGAVLRIAPRGGGGLFVYDALGRAGVAWRIGSLPSEMGGRWILRTIEGGELPIVLILRGQGEASLLSYDERLTHEIWPLQRAEVPLSWVRMAEEPILETLHPLPGGSWLLRSHPEQPARVLHRADQRPSWLPPVSVDDDEPAED